MSSIQGAGGSKFFSSQGAQKSADGFLSPEQQEMQKKLRDVADQYEKFFIKEMMRHMQSSLNQEGGLLKKNNAEKIFSEQLNEQYSAEWNKRGGFGISDMIYDSVIERHGGQLGLEPSSTKALESATNGLSGDDLIYNIEKMKK